MSIKDKEISKAVVINLEFSPKGDILAISYDTVKQSRDAFDSKLDQQGSFVSIYLNRTSHKASKYKSSDKNLYFKQNDIRYSQGYEQYQTD